MIGARCWMRHHDGLWARVLGVCVLIAVTIAAHLAFRDGKVSADIDSASISFARHHVARSWLPGNWIRVGSVAADSLLNPRLVAASASQVVLLDFGDHRLKAFGPDGTFLAPTNISRGGALAVLLFAARCYSLAARL